MQLLLAAIALAATALQGPARGGVFENDLARFVLDANGQASALTDKGTGTNLLGSNRVAFATVTVAGRAYPATAAGVNGTLVELSFGDSGVTAEVQVTVHPRYFAFALTRVTGTPGEVWFAVVDPAITANVGTLLNVKWDERFAVCVMALDDGVNVAPQPLRELGVVAYPAQGLGKARAALIATPTPGFLDAVRQAEQDNGIPSPTIANEWAKRSVDDRTSYLFTDLTEANADEVIRLAKLADFKYIMISSSTWATSLGSYPINTKSFPRGEASLKATIDKCHAAGLKVGMHMLTSFVSKNDPLVTPRPDPGLLKDAEATLTEDVDAKATTLPGSDELRSFPTEAAVYGVAVGGLDVQIDDEIIHYRTTGGQGSSALSGCIRGYNGTNPAPHRQGAKIRHLCERLGSYLVDLRTPLKDRLADRVAGVFNRCGFDMIFFDGGERNNAIEPVWYWLPQQQVAIYSRLRRPVLVQCSGYTQWLWHIVSRGTCDDYAAVASKQYIDSHKIAEYYRYYQRSFMPAELGWLGVLDWAPFRHATSPDEIELYATRMLALDAPASIETTLEELHHNGRAEEMLALLGRFETLRLAGKVPAALRKELESGEWHLLETGAGPALAPVSYRACRLEPGQSAEFRNDFAAQPARFKVEALPALSAPGDPVNIQLLPPGDAVELQTPGQREAMPGALAFRVDLTAGAASAQSPTRRPGAPDLTEHRALAVTLEVSAPPPSGEPPVLNIQLECAGRSFRDYDVDLTSAGVRTVVIPAPTSARTVSEFRPAAANYLFKSAIYTFDYKHVVAVNFRWMRFPQGWTGRCRVGRLEALQESQIEVATPTFSINGTSVALPVTLRTGDYAEEWDNRTLSVFDRNGVLLEKIQRPMTLPTLGAGTNVLSAPDKNPAPLTVTVISLGEARRLQSD